MIEYGEVKSKLGSELEIYTQKNMGRFLSSGSQGHECDTTLVFVFCGSCDCILYAAMLLPIYQNMEVHL